MSSQVRSLALKLAVINHNFLYLCSHEFVCYLLVQARQHRDNYPLAQMKTSAKLLSMLCYKLLQVTS